MFEVGGLSLAIPSRMGARAAVAEGAPDQVWEGAYSDWPGGKPEVRALCRATAGGTEPLRVTHLWFPFSTYRKAVEAGEVGSAETREAFERTGLTVGQIFARPDGLPRPSLSHFNGTLLEEALAEGRREGVRCTTGPAAPGRRFCDIWFEAGPGVLVVVSAWLGPETEGEDPVADARLLLGTMAEWLRP